MEQGRRYLAAIQGIEPGDRAAAAKLASLAAEERASGRLAEIDPWLARETRLTEHGSISYKKGGPTPGNSKADRPANNWLHHIDSG